MGRTSDVLWGKKVEKYFCSGSGWGRGGYGGKEEFKQKMRAKRWEDKDADTNCTNEYELERHCSDRLVTGLLGHGRGTEGCR
jgi:hypothetical protein